MSNKSIILVAILLLSLTACQGASEVTTQPTEVEISPQITEEAYPPPGDGSYPAPGNQPQAQRTLAPYVFKESDAGYATIHGVIFVTDITLVQPDSNDAVFLVSLPDQGVSSIPMITDGVDLQAEVDERTGEFVFTNVDPGTYAVVVRLRGGSQMPAYTMDEGAFAIVNVTEEQLDTTIELDYLRIP
jgi:hypothetical protein